MRCVAKTPPSLAHPRGTPETPLAKRFEFWARTICPLLFQPHTKIALRELKSTKNTQNPMKIVKISQVPASRVPRALHCASTGPLTCPGGLAGHTGTSGGLPCWEH